MEVSWTWHDFWQSILPPEDISTTGYLIERLFNYTTYLNIFYFILVCLGIFGFSFLYYYRRHPRPYYTYGNKKIHLWVTAGIGLSVFLSVDMNITRISNEDMVNHFWNWPKKEENPLRVEVLAQQWVWSFRYPGKDDIFNTLDDIVSPGELVLPVGRKVILHMTSKDVIHALYVPNVRMKVDVIPGRITRLWFEVKKPGNYDIACAEMCGTHHYLMKAKLTVHRPDDFVTWQEQAQHIALAANDVNYKDSFWGWNWETAE